MVGHPQTAETYFVGYTPGIIWLDNVTSLCLSIDVSLPCRLPYDNIRGADDACNRQKEKVAVSG